MSLLLSPRTFERKEESGGGSGKWRREPGGLAGCERVGKADVTDTSLWSSRRSSPHTPSFRAVMRQTLPNTHFVYVQLCMLGVTYRVFVSSPTWCRTGDIYALQATTWLSIHMMGRVSGRAKRNRCPSLPISCQSPPSVLPTSDRPLCGTHTERTVCPEAVRAYVRQIPSATLYHASTPRLSLSASPSCLAIPLISFSPTLPLAHFSPTRLTNVFAL